MTTSYSHESADSSSSALLLLDVGSGDNGVLVPPVGSQNSPRGKNKRNLYPGTADIGYFKNLKYGSDETTSIW